MPLSDDARTIWVLLKKDPLRKWYGHCEPSNIRVPLLDTFTKGYGAPTIDLLDQKLVNRCNLGALNDLFWIIQYIATEYAH